MSNCGIDIAHAVKRLYMYMNYTRILFFWDLLLQSNLVQSNHYNIKLPQGQNVSLKIYKGVAILSLIILTFLKYLINISLIKKKSNKFHLI